MTKLKLKKNEFGLRVNCGKCNRTFNYESIVNCKCLNRQKYVSVVYMNNVKKTKTIESRNYEEALTAAIIIKKQTKEKTTVTYKKSTHYTVIEAANNFYHFKQDIDVPSHLKQNLSQQYLKEIEFNIGLFLNVLRNKKINIDSLKIEDLNDNHVGFWFDYIVHNYEREGTRKNHLRHMNSWINYVINELEIKMKNPFKRVKFSKDETINKAMTKAEFNKLLGVISFENGKKSIGREKKVIRNYYRDYLKVGFQLAIYTGCRRSELVNLKWSDVKFNSEFRMYYIEVRNNKVERITKNQTNKRIVDVSDDLKRLLIDLGLKNNQGTDNYLISPVKKSSRKTIGINLTKGFHHFSDIAFDCQKKSFQFKDLRKTHMTRLYEKYGENIIRLHGHSNMTTLWQSYIDSNDPINLISQNKNKNFWDIKNPT